MSDPRSPVERVAERSVPAGHEYTPENTTRARLHGREYRRCRTCNNAQQRAHRARRRARLKAER